MLINLQWQLLILMILRLDQTRLTASSLFSVSRQAKRKLKHNLLKLKHKEAMLIVTGTCVGSCESRQLRQCVCVFEEGEVMGVGSTHTHTHSFPEDWRDLLKLLSASNDCWQHGGHVGIDRPLQTQSCLLSFLSKTIVTPWERKQCVFLCVWGAIPLYGMSQLI